jgi:hypothetical protein
MIVINLLPPEHRPVERTPLPRLLTILVGILLSMALLVFWAFITFVKLPEATSKRDDRKRVEATLRVEAEKIKVLENKLSLFRKREETLRQLYRDRIRWTRVLDRIAESRQAGGPVVLTSMEIKSSAGSARAKGKATRQLILKGFVPHFGEGKLAGQQLNQACMDFVNRLVKDAKWKEIFEEGEPEFKSLRENASIGGQSARASAKETEGKSAPPMPNGGWEFEVVFTFKPSEPPPPQKVPTRTSTPRQPTASK